MKDKNILGEKFQYPDFSWIKEKCFSWYAPDQIQIDAINRALPKQFDYDGCQVFNYSVDNIEADDQEHFKVLRHQMSLKEEHKY